MVVLRLQQVGSGAWLDGSRKTKRLLRDMPPTLELWRTKLTRSARIVFEVKRAPAACLPVHLLTAD